MKTAAVLTSWVYQDEAYDPAVTQDYTCNYTDVTGQQNVLPSPNIFTAIIKCDQATLDAIEADPNYVVGWSEE